MWLPTSEWGSCPNIHSRYHQMHDFAPMSATDGASLLRVRLRSSVVNLPVFELAGANVGPPGTRSHFWWLVASAEDL